MNLEINGKTIEVKFTIGAIRELDKRYQMGKQPLTKPMIDQFSKEAKKAEAQATN